jgi:hypothetical protein
MRSIVPYKIEKCLKFKMPKVPKIEDFNHYSITPTLHSYVEQSRVVESPIPGGKPKTGPLGLDSLFGSLQLPS